MATYEVKYDIDGKPNFIIKDGNLSIPFTNELNPDFQEFLTWNAQQPIPLDYTTPIPALGRWLEILMERNAQLIESVWSQSPDAVLTPSEKAQWVTYREALFNIPFAYVNANDVVFPVPPTISQLPPSQALLDARARRKEARVTAKSIPNWATWTQADWNTYFTANLSDAQVDLVTTLAQARVMLKRQNAVIYNLVRLVIALRDQEMPDLSID